MKKAFRVKLPLVEGEIGFAGKIAVLLGVVLTVYLCNILLGIQLPGVTKVDIRPQIVLIAATGYVLGPVYGFFAGFLSNFFSDVHFGYGLVYLPSWSFGNGLIGVLSGLCALRKRVVLDRISHLTQLTVALVVINILPFVYATAVEVLRNGASSTEANINYFFIPAVLSNIVCMFVLFPAILLAIGRVRLNYPVRIALINYYLVIFVIFLSWTIFAHNLFGVLGRMRDADIENGNAFVVSFNHWTMLLAGTLLLSFAISSRVSKMLVSPIKDLEKSVFDVLKGKPDSLADLAVISKRTDELGVLSRTISLLGEKLIHTQTLFRDEMNKRMSFIRSDDSGDDVYVVAIVSMFGSDAYDSADLNEALKNNGKISNIAAIKILIDAAGLRELASTYTDAKVKKSIGAILPGLDDILKNEDEKRALALAADMNLIFKGRLIVTDLNASLESDFAYHLLENAQRLKTGEKRFIGYLTQNDIFEKMQERWFATEEFACHRLRSVMDQAIRDRVISGCQIKRVKDIANFDETLKISYSHCNYRHVKQLVGLLIGEGVQAKVQLERKLSSFIYLREWGEAPDLNLEECGKGFFIASRQDFDVVFEFASAEQRDRFQILIENYAKKESDDGRKLLFESWYQPLYCSSAGVEGYHKIADLQYREDEFVVHTYCKVEDRDKIVAYFKGKAFDFTAADIWVNSSFRRYLDGGSK